MKINMRKLLIVCIEKQLVDLEPNQHFDLVAAQVDLARYEIGIEELANVLVAKYGIELTRQEYLAKALLTTAFVGSGHELDRALDNAKMITMKSLEIEPWVD